MDGLAQDGSVTDLTDQPQRTRSRRAPVDLDAAGVLAEHRHMLARWEGFGQEEEIADVGAGGLVSNPSQGAIGKHFAEDQAVATVTERGIEMPSVGA